MKTDRNMTAEEMYLDFDQSKGQNSNIPEIHKKQYNHKILQEVQYGIKIILKIVLVRFHMVVRNESLQCAGEIISFVSEKLNYNKFELDVANPLESLAPKLQSLLSS